MSLKKAYTLFLTAVLVIAAVSCKKDQDTSTIPSLYGLVFNCPSFVYPEQEVRLKPESVEHPDGGEVGFYWLITPTMPKSDTTRYENGLDKNGNESDGTLTFKFSDTLGVYNVSCYAYADGYAGDSYHKEVLVVDGGLDKSITNTGIKSTDPKITHKGVDYYYATIDGLDYFRNNLSDDSCGAPYANQPAASTVFGRYYSYEEALTVCPEGWRLPTDQELLRICSVNPSENQHKTVDGIADKLFADASFNNEPILSYWPQVGEITNSTNLSLIPVGFANLGDKAEGQYPDASFTGLFEYAAVWTSDKVEDDETMAYYRYLVSDMPEFFVGKGDVKSFGASVRCIRSDN